MALLRSLFWFVLFLTSTFCFVVLFEHGFTNFGGNAQKELDAVKKMVGLAPKKAPAPVPPAAK